MTSNLPAVMPDGIDPTDGLEDFEGGTALPRLTLDHKKATFIDSATNEEYPELVGILLGMVKQRTMWSPEVGEEKGRPRCKSSDGITGYPNVKDKGTDDEFPWEDFPISEEQANKDEFGRPVLSCKGCPFAEWTQSKKGKSVPPPCKERYTVPILFSTSGSPEGPFDGAGVVSFQGSGIKGTRTYMSRFKVTKLPLYSAITKITLTPQQRGQVDFATPNFQRCGSTNMEDWSDYSTQLADVRDYLKAPPRPEDGSTTGASDPGAYTPAPQAARQQAAPAPAPTRERDENIVDATIVSETNVPEVDTDEDELPF